MTVLFLLILAGFLAQVLFAAHEGRLVPRGLPTLPKSPPPAAAPSPNDPPIDLVLGTRLSEPFILQEEAIQARMAVLGASGSGKSRFLFLLFASLLRARKGFLLIDPHGDLAHALLGYCAFRIGLGDTTLLRRLHFLEPGNLPFTLDPFAHAPLAGTYQEYRGWLKARVDRVCRNLMRRVSEGDQEVMLRLRRWMKNILYACGVALDTRNTHAGMHKALVFTDPHHEEFPALVAQVCASPDLPDFVRGDFAKLQEMQRPQDQEKFVESTINRLRDLLSPLVATIWAPREGAISMLDIIRSGGYVLVSLQETPGFSHDEKVVIGGLLIDEVLSAKQAEENVPEEKRTPFILGIDEFGEFLGEDLLRAFGAVRKYRLSIIVAGQDLSTMQKGELDLASKVLSQCMTKVLFNMTWPEDLEILARNLGYGNIDFTELVLEVERHGGYDFIPITEQSVSMQEGTSRGKGGSEADGNGGSDVKTHAASWQQTWGHAKTRQETRGDGDTRSMSDSVSRATGRGETLDIRDGFLRNRFPVFNSNDGAAHATQVGRTSQFSLAEGQTENSGEGRGGSDSSARGTSWSHTDTSSWKEDRSEGRSVSLAFKFLTLARIVRETQRTGKLESSVSDQFEKLKQMIHGLRPRYCLVKLPDEARAFLAEVATVREPFYSPTAKWKAILAIKRLLAASRPYYIPSADRGRDCPPPRPSIPGAAERGPDTTTEEENSIA